MAVAVVVGAVNCCSCCCCWMVEEVTLSGVSNGCWLPSFVPLVVGLLRTSGELSADIATAGSDGAVFV